MISRQPFVNFLLAINFNNFSRRSKQIFPLLLTLCFFQSISFAQETRLLRQPSISADHVVFTYAGDVWVADLSGKNVLRITSTAAVESNPHLSPDGQWIAFTSNRSGNSAIYKVSVKGGEAERLTWNPSSARVRGWTPDGQKILYASSRETAPSGYDRLWTVPSGGGPSTMLSSQWGTDASFSPDGKKIIIDKMARWDVEWRGYRGGQNSPLLLMELSDQSEVLLPNEKTTDIQPLWMNDLIYFLSDRDLTSNIWSYNPANKGLTQVTTFKGTDVKWIDGNGKQLVYERGGNLYLLNPSNGKRTALSITISADFPWSETKWEDVSKGIRTAGLSPTGKRAIMEARGEIFTIPAEFGDTRNITQSSGAADRSPIWSPKGIEVAWFSDADGKGYALYIGDQDGITEPRKIDIGESKFAWEPNWSPNGKFIVFVDDDVRIRLVNLASGAISTLDVGGTNIERGRMGLHWSPDSKWLAYSKTASNNFRQIKVYSMATKTVSDLTNTFADSFSPSWDSDGKHLYFLASTDLALGSGWANTSAMTADAEYGVYVINLSKEEASPFKPKSDEEEEKKKEEKKEDEADTDKKDKDKKKGKSKEGADEKDGEEENKKSKAIKIDFDGIDRRIIALPMPQRNYRFTFTGPKGEVFVAERPPNNFTLNIHKYNLEKQKATEFTKGVRDVSVSADGKKMMIQKGESWTILDTSGGKAGEGKGLGVKLKMKLDRKAEWKQIFEEAWRYERDYFYDPNMHGRDWQVVYDRYAPLIPFVRHRTDLTYILDQVNGELSVGHSFVFGGDYPETENSEMGLLGADIVMENNGWRIKRIYNNESWNPDLSSPLDRPELKIVEGNYLVGINGKPINTTEDFHQHLDGTVGKQTILHINDTPSFTGSWKEIVEPIKRERGLRQRAWVEDNRRKVDELSGGKLAYIWVPNTGGPGFVSFNRYYFAQQDKAGAVIDERFNGGGLLDDYMVDLMTRKLRAAITNEVPNGGAFRLPAGILGPKVLLINELAGSGGDFFPWVFRQQNAGPLIGETTWGGLVKSSTHYRLIDGGGLTAPDNAVFDPINNKWIAENSGVAPDIAVRQDAQSMNKGDDPQLIRAVEEALKLLAKEKVIEVVPPPFPKPATGGQ